MERRTKITVGEIVLILIIAAEVVIFLGYTKPGNFVLNGLGLTAVWGSSSDCWIRGVDRMVIRKPLAIPPALANPSLKIWLRISSSPTPSNGMRSQLVSCIPSAAPGPQEKVLRLSDVKEMYAQMRDQLAAASPQRTAAC